MFQDVMNVSWHGSRARLFWDPVCVSVTVRRISNSRCSAFQDLWLGQFCGDNRQISRSSTAAYMQCSQSKIDWQAPSSGCWVDRSRSRVDLDRIHMAGAVLNVDFEPAAGGHKPQKQTGSMHGSIIELER